MAAAHPPLPMKIKAYQYEEERKTRRDWERYLHQVVKGFQKMERREKDAGLLDAYDLSGAVGRRRMEAILNSMPTVYERYQPLSTEISNVLGEEWVSLNTAFCTYSFQEAQSHILFAAALWILDHIDVTECYPYLPQDEDLLDDVYPLDVWDTQYDYELILSVQYVLEHRDGQPEDNGRGYYRTITDRASAEGTQHTAEKDRRNFDALLSLLPEEEIQAAVKQFEELFWKWTDQYFLRLKEHITLLDSYREEWETLRIQLNALIDDLGEVVKEMEREEKAQKKAKNKAPLAVLAPQQKPPALFPGFSAPPRQAEPVSLGRSRLAAVSQRLLEKQNEMGIVSDKIDEQLEKEQEYIRSQLAPGGGTPLPLDDCDPYALCFALLYLVDSGSDLPWLYGPGVMLIDQVTQRLPWGIIEYDEEDDALWWGEEEPYTGKPSQIPDWYERKYRKKDDWFPRSLAQLLYEETGCIMPRELHLYDGKLKELGRYGVRGKDAAMLLTCMTALANARRQTAAVNFRSWTEDPIPETAESAEGSRELKDEIRRLKAALHDAEKSAREAHQELDAAKRQAAQERRELADLRELVFSQEQEPEQSEEAGPQLDLPYTVGKETLIFGGHDSWLKAIKPMLKGNVRFIDRDYVFDTAILRRAEIIWIQTNSISHKQYYRIIDTARQFKTPVRYFTQASALKCATQVIENDTPQPPHLARRA